MKNDTSHTDPAASVTQLGKVLWESLLRQGLGVEIPAEPAAVTWLVGAAKCATWFHVCSHCLHPGHPLSFEACFLIVPILSWSMTVCRSLSTQVPCVFQWLPESWLWPFLGDFLAFKASMSPFCYCNQPWNKLTEMKALFFSRRFGGFSLWSVGSIACELLISWPGCKKRKEEGLRSLLYNQNTSH